MTARGTPLPDLVGSRVLLRRPLDADIDTLVRLPIDPGVERMYGAVHQGPLTRSREAAEKVIRWMQAEPVLWAIDVDGVFCG